MCSNSDIDSAAARTLISQQQVDLMFCLGGHDLEMVEIARFLNDFSPNTVVHDHDLPWGARASNYQNQIEAALDKGLIPVLVELENDLALDEVSADGLLDQRGIILIDHHNERAGKDAHTSLEQVIDLVNISRDKLPARRRRWLELVSANDRGHTHAMKMLNPPASLDEMLTIRTADRRAQRVTDYEEQQAVEAAKDAETISNGSLTIVRLPHSRTSPVVDFFEESLGGPGYRNLLIECPESLHVFGTGHVIKMLLHHFPRDRYPHSWSGGNLPDHGFWGSTSGIEKYSTFFKNVRDMVENAAHDEQERPTGAT